MAGTKHTNVDDYIASFPRKTQLILKKLRQTIMAAEPRLTEGISYAIPTFYLNDKYLVYMAGFKNHVGVYPATTEAVKAVGLTAYKVSTGTLQFPMDKPVPYELIANFVLERVKEVGL